MFAKQQLSELAARQELLVVEAELHRSVIGLECGSLRARLASLKARKTVAAGKPLLIAGSAAAGLLAMRHWRKLAGWIPTALAAFRFVKALKADA